MLLLVVIHSRSSFWRDPPERARNEERLAQSPLCRRLSEEKKKAAGCYCVVVIALITNHLRLRVPRQRDRSLRRLPRLGWRRRGGAAERRGGPGQRGQF